MAKSSSRWAAGHDRTVAALWQTSWFNGNGSTWDKRSVLARETLDTAPLLRGTCNWVWSDAEVRRSCICSTGDCELAIVVTTELAGVIGDNLSVANSVSVSGISSALVYVLTGNHGGPEQFRVSGVPLWEQMQMKCRFEVVESRGKRERVPWPLHGRIIAVHQTVDCRWWCSRYVVPVRISVRVRCPSIKLGRNFLSGRRTSDGQTIPIRIGANICNKRNHGPRWKGESPPLRVHSQLRMCAGLIVGWDIDTVMCPLWKTLVDLRCSSDVQI